MDRRRKKERKEERKEEWQQRCTRLSFALVFLVIQQSCCYVTRRAKRRDLGAFVGDES